MKQPANALSQVLVKTNILGTQITNVSAKRILEYLINFVEKEQGKLQIVTPNPEIIVYAHKHPKFQAILNNAAISLADGVGVLLAASFLGQPLEERVTGVDFMEEICKKAAQSPITVGFLGAGPGVAQATAECLKKKYPGLRVSFAAAEISGGLKIKDVGFKNKTEDHKSLDLHLPQTDILFVALGFPKQEEWIAESLDSLPVRLAMGVGGAFDYISGKTSRAPLVVRLIGFEWLYRLIKQPWRWKRQTALMEFIGMVLKERTAA